MHKCMKGNKRTGDGIPERVSGTGAGGVMPEKVSGAGTGGVIPEKVSGTGAGGVIPEKVSDTGQNRWTMTAAEEGKALSGTKAEDSEKKANRKDIRAKDIFGNRELCAQFLRDYADIPLLRNVQPQDIQEAELRHHFFDEAELNSDNVKRIRITDAEFAGELPEIYVVALIEHKSYVDYDVAMQMLRYMVCIWYDWAKEEKSPSEHRRKDFKYPPVIPIVYYEGKQEWTAGLRFRDRILLGEMFGEFIPDFTYRIVENQKYTQDELLLKEDEISLLMLLSQIQTAEDSSIMRELPKERLNAIVRHSSEAVLNEVLKAVQGLCRYLNLTEAETMEYTQKVKERNMGYLWENAEKVDIQEERRLRMEAQERLAEARAEAQRKLEKTHEKMIRLLSEMGMDEQTARQKLEEMEKSEDES